MRRDHSDHETVDTALKLDRERHPEPGHFGWVVVLSLAAWVLIGVLVALASKVWGYLHG